jgi:hypothetical protein
MRRLLIALGIVVGVGLLSASGSLYTTYSTGNGLAPAVVQLCPNTDGTQTAIACSSGGGGGGSVTAIPSSGPAVPCGGSTGDLTLTTTAQTICAAGTTRSYFRVNPTSGTFAGVPLGYCTVDGSTASATNWDYALNGSGSGFDSSGLATVPNGGISCVASAAQVTLTIKAAAIQTGSAP